MQVIHHSGNHLEDTVVTCEIHQVIISQVLYCHDLIELGEFKTGGFMA